jgi:hypothetical protein
MRAERARNYPSQRILQNQTAYGKDRQRYPLYLTVFSFRLACISKKTVRNTVNLSAANRITLARRLAYSFFYSMTYGASRRDLTTHFDYSLLLFNLLKSIDIYRGRQPLTPTRFSQWIVTR